MCGNKGNKREHFRLFPRGQNQQEEGNMEHPLSIEGSVPLFRSPDAGSFSKNYCSSKPFGLQ